MAKYPFPLCIQLTPPDNLYEDAQFNSLLALLKKLAFYGVELNLTDFSSPDRLNDFLSRYGLRLSMVATGVYAKQNGLSLSAADEDVRKKTVEEIIKILPFARACNAGIIFGYIKGGPNENKEIATAQMGKSLAELSAANEEPGVELYLEATNRYEATLVNTLKEGADFASHAPGRICILPDTYHMNLEEVSFAAELSAYKNRYSNVHLSDSNRYFPGFGTIDFFQVCTLLRELNYSGTISIEGRVLHSLEEDISAAATYLQAISRKLP